MVPSLPVRLKLPEMPNDLLCCALAAKAAWRPESGTASTNPRPNVGVGMRKMALFAATAAAKFGCWMLQPGASERPVMTKRSCTPPSGVPSGLRTKRTSRTGPFAVMNDGTVFLAPPVVAAATCGLVGGLEPPAAGCAWHPTATIQVETRAQALGNRLDLVEHVRGGGEKIQLVLAETGSGPPAPEAPPR